MANLNEQLAMLGAALAGAFNPTAQAQTIDNNMLSNIFAGQQAPQGMFSRQSLQGLSPEEQERIILGLLPQTNQVETDNFEHSPQEFNPSPLYQAISTAETGGQPNPFIRTKVSPKEGSSAFGPVQITRDKIEDYITRGLLSPENVEFAQNYMIPMQDKFLEFGREPNKPGYDPIFDYGGTGGFSEDLHEGYNRLAEEMLAVDFNQANGDIDRFIELWRGTADDTKYNDKVKEALNQLGVN